MKNLKVFNKLIIAFLIILAMSAIMGAISIIGMVKINKIDAIMYAPIIGVFVCTVVVTFFLAFYISRLIGKPIDMLAVHMRKAAVTGDLYASKEFLDEMGKHIIRKDEIGQLISATSDYIDQVKYIFTEELKNVSEGDLSVSVAALSDKDIMGISLKKMLESLNEIFKEINESTVQVSLASKQVAHGAQDLAHGVTEQAANVEELSSFITEISQKTTVNADLAAQAAKLANEIKGNAEKGSKQMDEMIEAVKDMNLASQNIGKVIKVIDDIAFQTNILALNAAVEAAHAGQHGKGFAVVAEEVRNLAVKSAEAAKETHEMIQNSMGKAELGTKIAAETAASLSGIVSGIIESDQIMSEIAQYSTEQAEEIRDINISIDHVTQIIQQNSATAEESAAASEEMSRMADLLKKLIAQFKLRDDHVS